MGSLQEARAKLLAHFSGDSSKHPDKWSELWDKGDFLPWDRNMPNPALVDVLTDRQDLIGSCMTEDAGGNKRRKRALVPGCGRGYDVLLLASFGYDAYGLEVSETAVKQCIEEKRTNGKNFPVKDESAGPGNASFFRGDFFKSHWFSNAEGDGTFDLIYDYTFLCALPPSFRPGWALRMSQLLAIEGRLICLEFPTTKDSKLGGPPFGLPPPVYVQLLRDPGREIDYDDEGQVKEETGQSIGPEALKRIAHWQPARTHEIGKGTDWVSVWQH